MNDSQRDVVLNEKRDGEFEKTVIRRHRPKGVEDVDSIGVITENQKTFRDR